MHQLNRNVALEGQVKGFVNRAHAAFPQQGDNLITVDRLAGF
jgi:hypothetical protein